MSKYQTGRKNGQWKGGKTIASNGYVLIRVGADHRLADSRGYAYEHRLVAERKLGRPLKRGEIVHHKDGNKRNNDPANLVVVASSAHHYVHHRRRGDLKHPDDPNPVIACACGCGETFAMYDAAGRPRRFVSGHNPQPAELRAAILGALSEGPKSRTQLAAIADTTTRSVACALSRMRKAGDVVPVGRGVWRAA